MEDLYVNVAVDAMGGDFAPAAQVEGAVHAVEEDEKAAVTLFGDEGLIKAELSKYEYDSERISVVHCESVIENCEAPVPAIKKKRDSSMVKALYAVKNGQCSGCVSCGNTGALLVGGQVIVGRLPGIERPALAFIVPTLKGPAMIIDCGATVDAKPSMLVHFAKMASVYMETIAGIENPRVGIINIGEEEEKGNQLVLETFPLLKEQDDINFIGSVESRGITEGQVDVAVCDAFVGNVVLKMYEGVAAAILTELKSTLLSGGTVTKLGAAMIKKDLKKMLRRFSIEEYGGAPMLGLKAPVIKTHGNSKAAEVKNTIIQCEHFVSASVSEKIAQHL